MSQASHLRGTLTGRSITLNVEGTDTIDNIWAKTHPVWSDGGIRQTTGAITPSLPHVEGYTSHPQGGRETHPNFANGAHPTRTHPIPHHRGRGADPNPLSHHHRRGGLLGDEDHTILPLPWGRGDSGRWDGDHTTSPFPARETVGPCPGSHMNAFCGE